MVKLYEFNVKKIKKTKHNFGVYSSKSQVEIQKSYTAGNSISKAIQRHHQIPYDLVKRYRERKEKTSMRPSASTKTYSRKTKGRVPSTANPIFFKYKFVEQHPIPLRLHRSDVAAAAADLELIIDLSSPQTNAARIHLPGRRRGVILLLPQLALLTFPVKHRQAKTENEDAFRTIADGPQKLRDVRWSSEDILGERNVKEEEEEERWCTGKVGVSRSPAEKINYGSRAFQLVQHENQITSSAPCGRAVAIDHRYLYLIDCGERYLAQLVPVAIALHANQVRFQAAHPPPPPGFSHVGIVPNGAAGRRVFSRISRFRHPYITALLHAHIASPSSALKTKACIQLKYIRSHGTHQSDIGILPILTVVCHHRIGKYSDITEHSLPNSAWYNPFTVTSHFSEALLKFYFQDIPPPRATEAYPSIEKYTKGQHAEFFPELRATNQQMGTRVSEEIRAALNTKVLRAEKKVRPHLTNRQATSFLYVDLFCDVNMDGVHGVLDTRIQEEPDPATLQDTAKSVDRSHDHTHLSLTLFCVQIVIN
ncbi:hypothetical protein PR048_014305 [Dryococelus australis]|uniref:Uncharacterized protein n=1 Tax=Dryococelus australis TaxID=614101 RepID=A0ABQ9HDY1_9NEOP|nr:hypothetical protein PR048_014305 [Dryococelus australis]